MKTIFLKEDLGLKGSLHVTHIDLYDRRGNKHRYRAIEVPGYGLVPCSKRLENDFSNFAENLAIVQNDDEDNNPPYSSHIWITRIKVDYAGDWDELDNVVEKKEVNPEQCFQSKHPQIIVRKSPKKEKSYIDTFMKESIAKDIAKVGENKYLYDLVCGPQIINHNRTEHIAIVKRLFPDLSHKIEMLERDKEYGKIDRHEELRETIENATKIKDNKSLKLGLTVNAVIILFLLIIAFVVNGTFKTCSSHVEYPTNEDIRILQPIHPR